jgi:hypothetical protein
MTCYRHWSKDDGTCRSCYAQRQIDPNYCNEPFCSSHRPHGPALGSLIPWLALNVQQLSVPASFV